MPDPDLVADMYASASDRLQAAGFVHYEISNWARKRTDGNGASTYAACRHNLQYWRNRPYLGFGAGAHGCAAGWRYSNVRSPKAYIHRICQGLGYDYPVSPAVVERRVLTRAGEMNETMMLGLRLLEEGIDDDEFRVRYGILIDEAFPKPVQRLLQDGLVRREGGRLRLTPRAHFIANQVFCMFV
jgi:oxygen-independent coproporphyrinogen-3 oxidase